MWLQVVPSSTLPIAFGGQWAIRSNTNIVVGNGHVRRGVAQWAIGSPVWYLLPTHGGSVLGSCTNCGTAADLGIATEGQALTIVHAFSDPRGREMASLC